jgi:hypothetical protein
MRQSATPGLFFMRRKLSPRKSEADQAAEAAARFREFYDREPKYGELASVPGLDAPTVAMKVGTFVGIAYRSLDGEEFMHYFESTRPLVFVNSDGDQIYILGGEYEFTKAGFDG